jgi:hypothetical protein
VAIEAALPQLSEQAGKASERLLGDVSDADLCCVGVDEQVLLLARALTTLDQLEATRGILPEPQYDVLLGLAMGMTPEDVWAEVAGIQVEAGQYDPEDVTAAIERSPKQVVLVEGSDELMVVFSYPFALWRVYLHTLQQRMAYRSFNGLARVTGGPGTGKTVVALHHAKYFAERKSGDRSVLVTSFTKTLTASLEDGLRMLIDEEDVLRRGIATPVRPRRSRSQPRFRPAAGNRAVGLDRCGMRRDSPPGR